MAKGKKTGGRTRGTPNKLTGELKGMILQALADSGGVAYLTRQAKESPTAFMSLLGRVLPLNVEGEVTHNYVALVPQVANTTAEWSQQHAPTIQ